MFTTSQIVLSTRSSLYRSIRTVVTPGVQAVAEAESNGSSVVNDLMISDEGLKKQYDAVIVGAGELPP